MYKFKIFKKEKGKGGVLPKRHRVKKMIVLNKSEVEVSRGERFEPRYIISDRAISLLDENMIATCDFVAYVEFDHKGQIKHCRDAIKISESSDIVVKEPKFWSRLRRACEKNNKELVTVPGGDVPYCYHDEVIVANFKNSGSSWYIIKESEIGALLKSEPKMTPEEAKIVRLSCGKENLTILDKYLIDNEIYLTVIEHTSRNSITVREGGCCCRHTINPHWDGYITDGNIHCENDIFPVASGYSNQYHNGCIDGYIYPEVKEFKYIIEWYMSTHPNGSKYHSINRILIKKEYENDTHILQRIIEEIKEAKIFD